MVMWYDSDDGVDGDDSGDGDGDGWWVIWCDGGGHGRGCGNDDHNTVDDSKVIT